MNRRVLEKASPARIQSLFGLFPRALGELLAAVLPVLLERRQQAQERRPGRQRAVGGGRTRRLAPYQEVLGPVAQSGQEFWVSASVWVR